jgi:hypothetical protein
MVCIRCGHVGADVWPDWSPHVNKPRCQNQCLRKAAPIRFRSPGPSTMKECSRSPRRAAPRSSFCMMNVDARFSANGLPSSRSAGLLLANPSRACRSSFVRFICRPRCTTEYEARRQWVVLLGPSSVAATANCRRSSDDIAGGIARPKPIRSARRALTPWSGCARVRSEPKFGLRQKARTPRPPALL